MRGNYATCAIYSYAVKLDLRTIHKELATVAYKWFKIGIQLGVPYHKLKEFEKDNDPLASTFHYLLSNGTTGGAPLSWVSIVEALNSDHVGEHGLAMSICDKYEIKKVWFSFLIDHKDMQPI